jgi:hypothetical protein
LRGLVCALLVSSGCWSGVLTPTQCEVDAHCLPGRRCFDSVCINPDDLCREPACALLSLSPGVAESGDTLELEGLFGPTVLVKFPSGVEASATTLGPYRATVTVPDGAGAGDLTLVSAGRTLGPLPFRQVRFRLGMAGTRLRPEQVATARTPATLIQPRTRFAVVSAGSQVFALGGQQTDGTPLVTIERATRNADGTLSAFAPSPVSLSEARAGAAVVVAGRWVYLIGGSGAGGIPLRSVERASLSADGVLGPFVHVGDLRAARSDASAALAGNRLHVIGGFDANRQALGSCEHAHVDALGELEPFATGPAGLQEPRAGAAAWVSAGALWVAGGFGVSSIERGELADAQVVRFSTSQARLIEPRGAAAAVRLGRWLYLLAGEIGDAALATIERVELTGTGVGLVEPAGTLPAPRSGASVVRGDNALHIIGGRGAAGALASVETFGIDQNARVGNFTAVGHIDQHRSQHKMVVLGRWLYVLGGRDYDRTAGAAPPIADVARAPIAADGTIGAFTTWTQLARPRFSHGLATIGSTLYVVGGADAGSSVTLPTESAPIDAEGNLGAFTARGTFSAARSSFAVAGDSLYVFGGRRGPTALKTIARARVGGDGMLEPFSPVGDLLVARDSAVRLVVGGAILLAGGQGPGGEADVYSSIERIDIDGDGVPHPVAHAASLSQTRAEPGAVFVGDRWYLLGGYRFDTTLDTIESARLDPDGQPQTFSPSLDTLLGTSRFAPSAVVLGDWVYAIAGLNHLDALSSIERAPLEAAP